MLRIGPIIITPRAAVLRKSGRGSSGNGIDFKRSAAAPQQEDDAGCGSGSSVELPLLDDCEPPPQFLITHH